MRRIRVFWRSVYDVRPGEGVRTLCMALHMTCILFAYYILKPVSRALFLNKFDIDQLPYLYVLIAGVGGVLAYAYTKVAVRSSLAVAVNWATGVSLGCLIAIWWLLRFNLDWMLYVFNIWVSLFSIVMVSQAWLVAANVFNSREAKRLYGLLGLSAVAGAAFGGEFTARLARVMEPHNLLLATAGMVLLADVFLRIVAAQKNVNLKAAKGAGSKDAEFSFADIVQGIRKHRHLQVIIAIITITFVVDVMVEFQFNAMAKAVYSNKKELTAFLGSFYGLYLNLATFVVQFFLTALIVRYTGVGGTLRVLPVAVAIASGITIFIPRLGAAAALRLSEAAARYSLNRTGMELLYLPLPAELKNRTKAFVDIFMDRFGRGVGGMLLVGYIAWFEKDPKHPNLTRVSMLILGIAICWILLTSLVSREYLATIRRRLASRRLDLADARISVTGAETIAMLEKTAAEGTPRQAAYAVGLLAEAAGYHIERQADALGRRDSAECRTMALRVSTAVRYDGLIDVARRALEGEGDSVEQQCAIDYLMAVSPEKPIDAAWIRAAAADAATWRRALAAYACGRHSSGGPVLRELLHDRDASVASAACHSAGHLADRVYFGQLVERLGDRAVRGAAVEALAMYGARMCGSLSDVLTDPKAPAAVRRQIPRVLRLLRDPKSVQALAAGLDSADPGVRAAVVKAMNRLRVSAPELEMPAEAIQLRLRYEVAHSFRVHAQLSALRDTARPRSAGALLVRTLEDRFHESLEQVFRLLGLSYPPDEIYNCWLAHCSGVAERVTAAHDYLDSKLSRETKHIVMPLLDTPSRLFSHGRDLFGIDTKTAEAALRELLASGDMWLTTLAIGTAAELKLSSLTADIVKAGEGAGSDVVQVARAAAASLS
jgi:ATP:ADP antiporter, AAA family